MLLARTTQHSNVSFWPALSKFCLPGECRKMGKNWDVPCGADLSKAADAGGAGHRASVSPGQGTPELLAASPLLRDVLWKLLPQQMIKKGTSRLPQG